MRLRYATRLAAGTKANEIHAWMIANIPAYAKSVEEGHTLRWANAYQDLDTNGVPIPPGWWYVNCKARAINALSPGELAAMYPYRTG
jgi:hypothetical protein